MRNFLLEIATNIAIGSAIVLGLGGAYYAFVHTANLGIFTAISAAILGFLPALIIISFFGAVNILFEMSREQKKQTEILANIEKSLKGEEVSDN